MKKNALKILTVFAFALCFSLQLSAQQEDRPERENRRERPELTEEEKAERAEKKLERLEKTAQKLDMSNNQKKKFIAASMDFDKQRRDLRGTAENREAGREASEALRERHEAHLASFLSDEQLIELKAMRKNKKGGKRKGKKRT